MLAKFMPIMLVILSSLFYHLLQKSTPVHINPLITLIVTYGTATLVSIVSFIVMVSNADVLNLINGIKTTSWTSILLGFAVVGLELGFLLSYRSGLQISSASLISNVTVALALIPIGFLLYRESITSMTVFGVLLCISGLMVIGSA